MNAWTSVTTVSLLNPWLMELEDVKTSQSWLVFTLKGRLYSHDIFHVEGFPLQRPDWRVIYCNGLLYVFPTRNIVDFLINLTLLTTTYLPKSQYSLFVLKVPLNPNQPIRRSRTLREYVHCPWWIVYPRKAYLSKTVVKPQSVNLGCGKNVSL